MITKKSLMVNVIIFVLYVLLSVITYSVVGNFLHIFLIWNLFLAAIPFGIVVLVEKHIIKKRIIVVIALLLWLFFFPNAIYMITDLIYINSRDFIYQVQPYGTTQYIQSISAYLALFHIYLGGFIGAVYGIKSVYVLYEKSLEFSIGKYRDICILGIFLLSALGIYIGRFFRYNSWEVIRVFSIIKDFFGSFSWFTVFFVFFVWFLQCLIFYVIKYNFIQKK